VTASLVGQLGQLSLPSSVVG